jgi:type II secretion system protein J
MGKKGFTLMEILVAIFLLSIVLVTVYKTFQVHVQSIERAKEIQQETHVARMVLSMMARDVESAYWEEQPEREGGGEGEEQTAEPPAVFMVQSVEKDGQPWDRISFLSLGPAWGPFRASTSRVHEVEYRLARDQETDKVLLVRREDPTPDEDLLSGGEEWLLSDNVRAFEVLCVDGEGETTDTWDSRTKGFLPRSVILHLWLWDPQKPEAEPVLWSLRVATPSHEGVL